ncbi:MAG: acyl carrier protein [Chloroflexi bacterium]|nr:acyl carrier protein [Chloroflexota bacterium]
MMTQTIFQMDVKESLRQFILGELLLGRAIELRDDDDLLLSGLVDSLGAVRMIAFIETEFKTTIPPEDVVIENFQTLDAMAEYLSKRMET